MLFNPKKYNRFHADDRSRELVLKTINFFEQKGLAKIKEDDQSKVWYQDFLDFIKEEKIFSELLTPEGYGGGETRWDMWRISEFNEVLAFYGLSYWYSWQVSILGLGPIWMGQNEQLKYITGNLLKEGGIFAFGLSERTHGADLYSSEMTLTPQGDGSWLANGSKYYIGNGNCAALVSTFGKVEDTGEYVFFAVHTDHRNYECVKKIDTSGVRQAYVAEYRLDNYPISEADIISMGEHAWNSSLNTVNIGKFELGCASIGIATHSFYEALNHASARNLYGRMVTDFPHVRKLFVESYARLVAMKLVAYRVVDYLRTATDDDRRYLLFNPIVKNKVTSQGEKVVALLHDVIAAKGFEQETYFEMAIRDIGMLPKLEGTEHVNMALIIKFIKNYFFEPVEYPEIPRQQQAGDDGYLFDQMTGKLGSVRFPDYRLAFNEATTANTKLFVEQVELFRTFLIEATPDKTQRSNLNYMLHLGELFTLIVYSQLLLENIRISAVNDALVDQMFSFLVQDFSRAALEMQLNFKNSEKQQQFFSEMLKVPVADAEGFNKVWQDQVYALKNSYDMK